VLKLQGFFNSNAPEAVYVIAPQSPSCAIPVMPKPFGDNLATKLIIRFFMIQ